ncbi:hypothetical protein SteCoe_30353 [Stentor coeruleus]|uniref:Vacuolar protein sorting-associated protein 26 n=1 Tax=Stentor coeruleus TaxID=5963 RepID=A0A1R2B447_9CILI|nr:hypothetical protein SteCoe_30353 [Stentor coeruleus]
MFGAKGEISLELEGLEQRKKVPFKDASGKEVQLPVYSADEDIVGKVNVVLKKGKKLEHQGIKIELYGRIDITYEKNQTSDFISLSRELEPPGAITQNISIPFSFNKVEKSYETYTGRYCKLRYFIKVTMARKVSSNMTKEIEFAVLNTQSEVEENTPIKMEVGIEECLHIEFEYNRQKYHLKDCIIGKVYFLLVRIRIKYMELAIIRRETIGAGAQATNENETIAKYEVMDGAPVRGENIPIRMFLGAFELTPTYYNVNNKFSVRHFLNLVLVDEEDRRYFKQQEIILWRKEL